MRLEVDVAELSRKATWSMSLAALLGGVAYWVTVAFAAPIEAATMITLGATGVGGILGRGLDEGGGPGPSMLGGRVTQLDQGSLLALSGKTESHAAAGGPAGSSSGDIRDCAR